MLEILYNDAKDEHVATYIAYGANENDPKLFYDKEHTKQVTKEDAQDAFFKGRLLVDLSEEGIIATFAAIVVDSSVLVITPAGEPGSGRLGSHTFALAIE